MSDNVIVERRGAVQWITIDREERRNSLNEAVVARIREGVAAAMQEESCRAVVLTGAGEKAFCAGADLARGTQGAAFDVDYAHPQHYIVPLFNLLETCPLPVIARVNGHALAGGFGLLCVCDLAVAVESARIGTPEPRIGVTPMMILPYMQRLLPARKVQEMCMTGDQFSAAQGLEWGVLNYVVPRAELDDTLNALLDRITANSPTAIRLGKQAFRAMRDMSLRDALEYAQVMLPVMASTEDAKEGLAAFQDKRDPQFTGR